MRAEQGVWHQWQRHTDKVWSKVAAGEDAPLVVTVVHGWVDGAGAAGTAAPATGVGTATSTASEAGDGEPLCVTNCGVAISESASGTANNAWRSRQR